MCVIQKDAVSVNCHHKFNLRYMTMFVTQQICSHLPFCAFTRNSQKPPQESVKAFNAN